MKNIIRLGLSICFALMMLVSLSFAQSTQKAPSKKTADQKEVSIKLKKAIKAHKAQTAEKKAVSKKVVAPAATKLEKKDIALQKRVKKDATSTPKKETPKKED